MTESSKVKVGIGMPVYNGQQYIREAIDSIVHQTYRDWELVICDNASTDDTAAICREYAARDPRIIYHRHPQNIGGAANFNRTFELSTGTYFKWAAHDDVLEPTWLEQCVAQLEANPDAVLCQSLVKVVNDHGECLQTYNHGALGTGNARPSERLAARLATRHCMDIFGLIRADTLHPTEPIRYHLGSDRTLLGELVLRGRFMLAPEFLFLNREHPQRYTRRHRDPRSELAWYTPAGVRLGRRDSWRMFRTWILYAKSLRLIRRHVDDRAERRRCYWQLFRSLRLHERWILLLLEPLIVVDSRFGVLTKIIKRALKRRGLYPGPRPQPEHGAQDRQSIAHP